MAAGPVTKQKSYHLEREPIVRIGIVLAEDQRREMVLEAPGEGYEIHAAGRAVVKLRPHVPVAIHAGSIGVSASYLDGVELIPSAAKLEVVSPAHAVPEKAGDGILVRQVGAGRGFHWQKKIDQTLSDTLEFQIKDGHLIMINGLPLETYLTGVITGEMSGDCPIEFLKAQATAARSWLLGQKKSPHPGEPFFWCNDDCCQRYQGTGGWSERAREAIRQCRGQVLITPTDSYCDARYSKSTGGISEDAINCWHIDIEGLEARVDAPAGDAVHRFFPITEANIEEYLTGDWLKTTGAFASPNVAPESTLKQYLGRVDEVGEYFRWEKDLTHDQLAESMRTRGGLKDLARIFDLRYGRRGRSGRLVTLHVDYRDNVGAMKTHTFQKEYDIRAAMDKKFLFSSMFVTRVSRATDGSLESVKLIGGGWGHGAGLCQIGGLGRALKGQKYDEILLHYYSNVRLEGIYS